MIGMTERPSYQPRTARPEDYDAIATVVDDWWGRPILAVLPRLFLDHFHATSLIVDGPGSGGPPRGFLIGILSPSLPDEAYIHFVGVRPGERRTGLARSLYLDFFEMARQNGRRVVKAITGPVNAGSIAFHQRMGFTVTGPLADYNGPGHDHVVFERNL
jgi:ribosomal protein S18 acetylase RimI-like enzyme